MTSSAFQGSARGFPETLRARSARSAKSPLPTPGTPRVRSAKGAKRGSGTFGTACFAHSQENVAVPVKAPIHVRASIAALFIELTA